MGGSVNILARLKDGSKIAFRTSTGCLKDFNNIQLLDESVFLNLIKDKNYTDINDHKDVKIEEHEDYYGSKTYFSPYAYGLLFFDYKYKKVFAANNYSGFVCYDSWFVKNNYKRLMNEISNESDKYDINIEYQRFDKQSGEFRVYKKENIFENPSEMYSAFFNMYQALINNGSVIYKTNELKSKDLYDVLSLIYGTDLLKLSKDELNDIVLKSRNERLEVLLADCSDIEIKMPEWEFIQGDGSSEDMNTVFEYLYKDNYLTDNEVKCWKKYLAENLRSNEEDED